MALRWIVHTKSNGSCIVGALLLAGLLVGCGTKGPLVLPDKPVTKSEGVNLASVGWVQPTIPLTHSRWVGTHPTLRDWFEQRAQ